MNLAHPLGSGRAEIGRNAMSILHSKRANIYYLEHCRVLVNGGRVEYVTDAGKKSLYWNIPIANTTSILLGVGTSITQAAVRELAKSGVMIGFCGGGGTPLFAGSEASVETFWLSPQSEYRATEYLQNWVRFWFDDALRLAAAKEFQKFRIEQISREWSRRNSNSEDNCTLDLKRLAVLLTSSAQNIANATNPTDLLTEEARLTKQLYRLAAMATGYGDFVRSKRGGGTDVANQLLDHGNYLAYGLGATATWVLGLPHSLPVLHGKTRRGGLVFDVADLIKDAIILPQAFVSAMRGDSEQEFRQACIRNLTRAEALDSMIEMLKVTAQKIGRRDRPAD